jgi:uncharacterized membrane protein
MRIKLIACAIATLGGTSTAWSLDYTVSTIDYPGATRTFVTGINLFGRVVGGYSSSDFAGSRGFTERLGVFTPIGDSLPCRPGGRCHTVAGRVNVRGEIAGTFSADVDFPGVFLQSGSVPIIVQPPGYPNTSVLLGGLNNQGVLAGCSADETGTQQIFVQFGTHFSVVPFPLSGSLGACATGINNLGQLTGYYLDSGGSGHGFMKTGDRIVTIDVPADWGSVGQPVAINDRGMVVGIYDSLDGVTHGYVWIDGHFSKIETSEATAFPPVPTALNNRGEIVGYYGVTSTVPSMFELRSFVSRAGKVTTLPVTGASSSAAINDRGEIVGYYTPAGCGNGCPEVHGFLAEPVPE